MKNFSYYLLLLAAQGLVGCFPAPGPLPQPLPSSGPGAVNPSAAPDAPTDPAASPTASPASPSAQPVPGPSGGAGLVLPAGLRQIRFAALDRFLNTRGQTLQLRVQLLDALGQPLSADAADLPLLWSNSRPDDFELADDGTLTARVSNGYSIIGVQIAGTEFAAEVVVNISSGGNSGGGGGGGGGGGAAPAPTSPQNQAPVITGLEASSLLVMGTGKLVKLNATASDSDSPLDTLSYSWSCVQAGCSAWFESTQGPEVYWRSPDSSGNYELVLTVSDGSGSSSESVLIDVQTGLVEVEVNPPPEN